MIVVNQKERLEKLIDAAVKVYSARGYRLTQMSDIAKEMGVAHGTVYNYVESKEDLYHFLIQYFFLANIDLEKITIPIKSKAKESTLKLIRRLSTDLEIFKLLERSIREGVAAPENRFEEILRTYYKTLSRYRHAITLILQSSLSWPELGVLFYSEIRIKLVNLFIEYMRIQIQLKRMREIPNLPAAARLIIETTTWFAVLRYNGSDPEAISDKAAEETILDTLLHAFKR
jgi:AcrR family transcriptional regulator